MKQQTKNNHGAALITSLVLLVALTMISLSAMQSTSVQLQISGNDEAGVEADQFAQSIVDAILVNAATLPVAPNTGYTLCYITGTGCDAVALSLTSGMFSTSGVQAKVEYLKTGALPRTGPSRVSSAQQFQAAYYEVRGEYDATSNGRGKSDIVQGIFVKITK
jgi:Tfp pilus assembly protein PilX